MRDAEEPTLTPMDYRALADFRYQIRRFVHFSESVARGEGLEPQQHQLLPSGILEGSDRQQQLGLEPQQHQLLLAVRAFEDSGGPTIRAVAEHLLIRHH